jgi:carboxylate-amine ligase
MRSHADQPQTRAEPLPLADPEPWPASGPQPADAGASAFEQAGRFTVGLEEELLLLDPQTLLPAPSVESALEAVDDDRRFLRELKQSQLEISTPPAQSVAEAGRELGDARGRLVERLAGAFRLVAVGTHPLSTELGGISAGRRYRALLDEYQWVARASGACGLHVHVAVGGAARSLAVFNAVRSYVPELAAIAGNSPFVGGEDTGLASVRQLGETFPRTGMPPPFASWEALAAYLRWGRRGGLFPDGTHFWWDLRPHLRHGTLELRVPDAQTRISDVTAIAALFACLAAELAAHFDAGERLATDPTYRIAENSWRALRYGVGGWMVDLATGEPVPARERLASIIDRLEPVAEELRCTDELHHARTLLAGTGADRQRYVAEHEGLDGLLRHLVAETEAPARSRAQSSK